MFEKVKDVFGVREVIKMKGVELSRAVCIGIFGISTFLTFGVTIFMGTTSSQ